MSNRIVVTVTAQAKQGKSAVALLVTQTLQQAGFIVSLIDDNGKGVTDTPVHVIKQTLDRRVQALIEGDTTVTVQTINSAREPCIRAPLARGD